ncbi:hypothetical protein ACLK29_07530 [Leptospira kirschneri]
MIRLTTRALSFNPLPLKEEEETDQIFHFVRQEDGFQSASS